MTGARRTAGQKIYKAKRNGGPRPAVKSLVQLDKPDISERVPLYPLARIF